MEHLAEDVRQLALSNVLHFGRGLKPELARLYSHHSRLREKQAGLSSWKPEETVKHLEEAVTLINAASILKEDGETTWQTGARRAGELLEWLAHPETNIQEYPLTLLAAAVYQWAGYPARASGLLNEHSATGNESLILRAYLKADFTGLERLLAGEWFHHLNNSTIKNQETINLQQETQIRIIQETMRAIGIICSELRWGREERVEKALDKLRAISKWMIYSDDPYSWLLAKLCVETGKTYIEASMRRQLDNFAQQLSTVGQKAMERYWRWGYKSGKALAWPSQIAGIAKLMSQQSFAFCTPTGSGKTTVAELAILQSLFTSETDQEERLSFDIPAPLVIYLVPSRALATEVESKLSKVLQQLGTDTKIQVTGLYGGTDWGPTDAWLTTTVPTVLICTYEKAEALLRFLGPLFINRIKLAVVDEAHSVQFNDDSGTTLNVENRALRLEVLGNRLFTYLDERRARVIALSAVARGGGKQLACWVTGQANAEAETIQYRSSRQLVGILGCLPNRKVMIRYDLLDGQKLQFSPDAREGPYIPDPFPPFPQINSDPSSKQAETYPYILWAAVNFAAPDTEGRRRAVLISLAQRPDHYCGGFLKLLEENWVDQKLPNYFDEPKDERRARLLDECKQSCIDYFGERSREYRLLCKGIVVHHGKMPGLLARLLIEVVEQKIIQIVVATSTLSEGINLPFETIIIPKLFRGDGQGQTPMPLSEFANLVGRAGRPGYGTEGRSLVVMTQKEAQQANHIQYKTYQSLINVLGTSSENHVTSQSPLAKLLRTIYQKWKVSFINLGDDEFVKWLEQTIPQGEIENLPVFIGEALDSLDILDGHLISAIVEIEELEKGELSLTEVEAKLKRIWQRSYAHFSDHEEQRLETYFLTRGQALQTRIYADRSERKRIYRTSLPPSQSNKLLSLFQQFKELFKTGFEFHNWDAEKRVQFIINITELFNLHPRFKLKEKFSSSKVTWKEALTWWLSPNDASKRPTESNVTQWISFVRENLDYKFNWGLGSVLSLVIDESFDGRLEEITLEKWRQTGMPWSVFWLKELMIWGTLEPVAAHLLSHRMAITRKEAESKAKEYYLSRTDESDPNELLNAAAIKSWSETLRLDLLPPIEGVPSIINIEKQAEFNPGAKDVWRVLPVVGHNAIDWIDPAGYWLAKSPKPDGWGNRFGEYFDFFLHQKERKIKAEAYI